MRKANPWTYALAGLLIGLMIALLRADFSTNTARLVGTFIGSAIPAALIGWAIAAYRNRRP